MKKYQNSESVLKALFELALTGKNIFRGISREVELLPTIQRSGQQNNGMENTIGLRESEYLMLDTFLRKGASYFSGNYDVLDYVTCAQHYGLPTRLIDWTKNPFIALYFSIIRNDTPDHGYYKIYYTDISEQIVIDRYYGRATWGDIESIKPEFIQLYKRFVELIENDELLDAMKHRKEVWKEMGGGAIDDDYYKVFDMTQEYPTHINPNGLIIFEPKLINDRLRAQEGLFSIPRSIDHDNARKEILSRTNCIEFTVDLREELINKLNNMGYTATRLFPGLDEIAKSIKNDFSQKTEHLSR
jgi:hypothetical protein